jgi:ribosomal protein S18 acetylase RimI-like enzyme
VILRWTTDEASEDDLLLHLQRVDADFIPPLSARVPLGAYAQRLRERARREEAWSGDVLVAMVAGYVNHPGDDGYITNVSALPAARGRGVVSRLLARWLDRAAAAGARSVGLHVHPDQAPAVRLYLRHGFRVVGQDGKGLHMVWAPAAGAADPA